MNLSQVGINLIKSFEGCRLTAYKVTSSEVYFTIGYGHYSSDIQDGQTITQAKADSYLKSDLLKFEKGVNELVSVPLNQYQFDAVVSFAYNCGLGALKTSDLLEKINQKDFSGAAKEFDKWIHSGGQILKGLVTRRQAEKTLFLKVVETPIESTLYQVVGGDNLTKISKKYGTTIKELLRLNPAIKNPNLIRIGQIIRVPIHSHQNHTQTYKIRSGDSLTKIAKIFHTSIQELMKLNPVIKNPNKIRAGQVIIVPK